jgi:hypothetical protein
MGSKQNLGEQFAIEFLARHGLRAERFSKAEVRQGKTPDFRVLKGTDFFFYSCSGGVYRGRNPYMTIKLNIPDTVQIHLTSSVESIRASLEP